MACVAAVWHLLARPVPGIGIALPVFVPAAITAVVALLLSRERAAPLAHIGGTLGTLIGADLLNLGSVGASARPSPPSAAPEPSMVGIPSVLLASLGARPSRSKPGSISQG